MVELIIAHAYSAEKNTNCAEGSDLMEGNAIFIWNTQRKSETRMMYLMFHHVTVLTRNGLDHGSPTNRLSSGSCLGDPSLANRPLLILKKLSPLSHYIVTLQLFSLLKKFSDS